MTPYHARKEPPSLSWWGGGDLNVGVYVSRARVHDLVGMRARRARMKKVKGAFTTDVKT